MVSMQMEENSPSPQPMPTPQCVGREFVRQYYTLLAEAPKYVHRFYSNESIFVHGSDTDEVVGQNAIQNKIRDLNFEECRTRIRALDAHETMAKGVVVQVVGEISVNGGPMRRFVQTFVLAPQSEKKYYVHNDIFRYEDELFAEKLPQENGAPIDPEAEATGADRHRRDSGVPDDQLAMNNGNIHLDEIQSSRHNLSQNQAQQPPVPIPVLPQSQNHPLPPQVGSGYGTIPAAAPLGTSTMAQQAGSYVPHGFNVGDVGISSIHPGSTTVQAGISQSVASTATPYNQQPLPQRQQPQQAGQIHSAPAPPAVAPVSTAPLPSSQPPPEPTPATGSSTATDQPPRPSSTEKTSPAPSEDREEVTDAGSAANTWANIAKQKSTRSPHQISASQQQPSHPTQGPGTSAPPLLSPTGAVSADRFWLCR